MKIKRMLIRGLVGLALAGISGCQREIPASPFVRLEPEIKSTQPVPERVSYKLEDFLDTEVKLRDIKLNVYIENSENIWNYSEHKDEIFRYVKDFFKSHKVNCKINYSKTPMQDSNIINEFGLEILGSTEQMNKRRLELILGKFKVSEKTLNEFTKIINLKNDGFAYTEGNICLVDGSYDIFMKTLGKTPSREEIKKRLNDNYQGISVQEAIQRNDADLICHEVLHCMGLFHPNIFKTDFFERYKIKDCPDIMILDLPRFDVNKQGYCLDEFQEKMMHSYLAGNNVYKAFMNSKKQLLPYLQRIRWENKLELN
jgi:hypothetical protein